MKEIRAKLLRIDPDLFLTVARIGKSLHDAQAVSFKPQVAAKHGYVASFDVLDIPEGASIPFVYYRDDMRCFVAYVEHSSFDEVPCGAVPPFLDDWATTKRINVFVDESNRLHPAAEQSERSPLQNVELMNEYAHRNMGTEGPSLSEIEQSWRDRPPLA